MVKNKKGAIGIQINWIFVLIAGAIILMIVFSFIVKQKRASQIKAADTLLKDIEAITTGTSIMKGGSQSISLPKKEVKFECTNDCACTISIGSLSKNYKEKQIFAPSKLEGLKAITWAKDLEVPFRVSNFLYITDRSTKYYFIYSNPADPLKQLIEKQLPAGVIHEFIELNTLSTIKNTGFNSNKFVLLNIPINTVTNVDRSFGKTASFVSLTDSTITFKEKPLTIINYISQAELFGAIFAANYQMYACNMEKVKERMVFVTQIYKEKAEELNQLATVQNLLCGYDTIIAELTLLETDKNVIGHYDRIKGLNEELVVKSCPLVY